MNTPIVSVVMSVYNDETYLQDAIDSILGQTFFDFELIVIDDGSNDKTPEILLNISDPRVIHLTNRQNIGLTRSLNKGLAAARGSLIARHDSDDVSHPDRFRQQVERMAACPEIGLLGTGYQVIDRMGKLLEVVSLPGTNAELQARLEDGNIFAHGSVMMRREVLEKAGGYRELFTVTQDYDLWLRMAEHCQVGCLPAALYQFRFAQGSISREKRGTQLIYWRLARELAAQRRSLGHELPIPAHVVDLYPPEPSKMFSSARGSAYLLYSSGQIEAAGKSLNRAKEIDFQDQNRETEWAAWTLAKACQLAEIRNSVPEGAGFIAWVYQILFPEDKTCGKRTLGRFYADQAFQAYQKGAKQHLVRWAAQAVSNDKRWLRNRGLWVIVLKSLIR